MMIMMVMVMVMVMVMMMMMMMMMMIEQYIPTNLMIIGQCDLNPVLSRIILVGGRIPRSGIMSSSPNMISA